MQSAKTSYICFNGDMQPADTPVFKVTNRGYRYGDGFFETMKFWKGKVLLYSFHLERIKQSLNLLNYRLAIPVEDIFDKVHELCQLNQCNDAARIRLSFFNGEGGVFDADGLLGYAVEATPVPVVFPTLNTNGLVMGFCKSAFKSSDAYASLKSANYLLYRMAADTARPRGWDDAFVLNHHGRVIESAIANIFWVKDGQLFTPPLSEGCVQGTMRAYILQQMAKNDFVVIEKPCMPDDILTADEIFLTNASFGISWVARVEYKTYTHQIIAGLYEKLIVPLYW
ncbi:MAG: aminotransferase class IV [Niabella sp.]